LRGCTGRGPQPRGERPRLRRGASPRLQEQGGARQVPGRRLAPQVHRGKPGELEEGARLRLLRRAGREVKRRRVRCADAGGGPVRTADPTRGGKGQRPAASTARRIAAAESRAKRFWMRRVKG